jgi:hypothetical protein
MQSFLRSRADPRTQVILKFGTARRGAGHQQKNRRGATP